MNEIFTQVISGIIVTTILYLFGIGVSKVIIVNKGGKNRKTGKKMIIIAFLMIFGGLVWVSNNSPETGGLDFSKSGTIYGMTLFGYGVFILIIGRIVAWYQRN